MNEEKGKFQFNGEAIWFCAACQGHCMAPHVEVGKDVIHHCVKCKVKVHTFCVSKNDDGVMLCAGCDPMHSYADAIAMCH